MRVVLSALVLLWVASGALFADKITADPNAGPAPIVGASPNAQGLERKVTYEGGYKRLHTACQEIKKLTGIRVSCGQTPSDWQVRDVPVTICARDIPLGSLLANMAGCAHAQFSRLRIAGEDEDKPSYTVFRTKEGSKAIAAPTEAKMKAARDRAKWAWDALSACARLPESAMPQSMGEAVWHDARLVGAVLSGLGTATRDSVVAGNAVKSSLSGLRDPTAAAQLHEALWDRWQARNPKSSAPKPDPSKAYIKLVYSEDLALAFGELKLYVASFPREEARGVNLFATGWQDTYFTGEMQATYFTGASWVAGLFGMAMRLIDPQVQGIPKPPSAAMSAPPDQTTPGPGFKALVTQEDWDLPELKAEVNLSLPPDPKDVTFADVLVQVSRSAAMNIFCEDFRTHKDPSFMRMRLDFGKNATVADILRGIEGHKWFFDQSSKTLVGWEIEWPERHSLLVREQILANLSSAINGRGADVDDVAPLLLFTTEQYEEWIADSREFSHIPLREASYFVPLWWLYDGLRPDQKRLAKSESGFPIGMLPHSRLDELAARLSAVFERSNPLPITDDSDLGVSFSKAIAALSGPTDAVLKVSSKRVKRMRVRVIESPERSCETLVDAPLGVEKLSYNICLEFGKGDEGFRLGPGQWQDGNFPILAGDRKVMLDAVAARKSPRSGRPN